MDSQLHQLGGQCPCLQPVPAETENSSSVSMAESKMPSLSPNCETLQRLHWHELTSWSADSSQWSFWGLRGLRRTQGHSQCLPYLSILIFCPEISSHCVCLCAKALCLFHLYGNPTYVMCYIHQSEESVRVNLIAPVWAAKDTL